MKKYIRHYRNMSTDPFDPLVPHDRLPPVPPTEADFDDPAILKAVNRANIALAGMNASLRLLPNPMLILAPLSLKEGIASSEIENVHTTLSDVFASEVLPEVPEIRTPSKEVLRYREALMWGLERLQSREFLNTNDYVKIQSYIEPDKGGIRKLPGTKIAKSRNGKAEEIIYTPPEGEERISKMLANYEKFYNDPEGLDDLDALVRMGILHYQFEAIHPFYDGNGRTGRILAVLYLVLTKRLDLPALFISGYLLRHRDEYYRLLLSVTKDGNWKDWTLFFLSAVEVQAKETSNTIMALKELMDRFRPHVETFKESSAVLDYLFSRTVYTRPHMAKTLGINLLTATKYLESLTEKGIFFKTKVKGVREFLYTNP